MYTVYSVQIVKYLAKQPDDRAGREEHPPQPRGEGPQNGGHPRGGKVVLICWTSVYRPLASHLKIVLF